MRRELPPFPENRKIREGGDNFNFYWDLLLVALAVVGVNFLAVCLLS